MQVARHSSGLSGAAATRQYTFLTGSHRRKPQFAASTAVANFAPALIGH